MRVFGKPRLVVVSPGDVLATLMFFCACCIGHAQREGN